METDPPANPPSSTDDAEGTPPKHTESVINHRVLDGGVIIAGVSGGVRGVRLCAGFGMVCD